MGGERLDTRNPTSKLMLTILAGVATWEREIMLERQREGIAKAKAAGKYKGRPISIDAGQIRQLRAELGPAAIAKRLGIAATLAQPLTGGLVVAADPFFNSRREKLVELAARHAVPAIYEWREFAQAGGLISYGPSPSRHLSSDRVYVGRVPAGASPADLPIQRPTRFELVVNLKTAKALGMTIPPSILGRANDIMALAVLRLTTNSNRVGVRDEQGWRPAGTRPT